jgi:hypothetical protein
MFSQTSRKAAATLLLAVAVTLSCAVPSQASLCHNRHVSGEDAGPGGGFTGFLLQLFNFIGGALDPNGIW